MTPKSFWLCGCGILMALRLCAAESVTRALSGHVPPAVAHLSAIGRLPATNHLDLTIGVPLRDAAGLRQFLRELYDPASTNFHRYLTPEQFTQRFGPTEQDYQAVATFARSHGLTVTHTHANRVLLNVNGAVADIEKAFHLTLRTYHHPTEPRDFFAPDAEPTLSAAVPALHISGLSDYARLRPNLRLRDGSVVRSAPQAGSGSGGSYFGDDFRNAYVPGTALTGAGQLVGLVQFDGFYSNDIASYAALAGGGRTNIVVQTVLLDGFDGVPTGDNNANGEVSLDIEMAMAMAPGLAKIVVFEAPNSTTYFNDILSAMSANYQIKNLSCSWGGGSPDATSEILFQQMAAQGQSFFNASGDSDAFTGLVPFPSDSPNITQVGGTTLTMNGAGVSYASETVWNWGNGTGSSGGVSTTYAIPAWQQGVDMTANGGSTSMRNTPDVAMTADNVRVYYADGGTGNFGGTSCAAPLWAGFMALVNEQAAAASHAPVGFLNPLIYAIGAGPDYTNCFNDTTTGNNFWSSSPASFAATNGYDLCTGWGSPAGTNLINALAGSTAAWTVWPADGFSATGSNGAAFNFTAKIFQLTNSGASAFDWQLAGVPTWLDAQPSGGTLAAGASASVVVSLNLVASNLPAGNYHADLWFTNLTTATAQPRAADVVVVSSSIVQNGGFETGDFTDWTLVGNGNTGSYIYNAVISANSIAGGADYIHSGSYAAFLGDSSLATLSQSLPTVPGQRYLLSFWLVNPASGSGQEFYCDWMGSASTNELVAMSDPSAFSWTNFTFVLTATDTNTVLQFAAANPPAGFGLDDVAAFPIPTPTFTSLAPDFASNAVALTWNTLAGISYQLEYTTNLFPAVWLPLNSFTAMGWTMTVTDTNAVSSSPQRFYRIVELP